MTQHRPSRWLAPLALLAAMGAVLLVVSGSTGDGENESENGTPTEERRQATDDRNEEPGRTEPTRTSTGPRRRTYTVRPGDTLALISQRTGVSVQELTRLNPEIDPNSLPVGDKIKLTE